MTDADTIHLSTDNRFAGTFEKVTRTMELRVRDGVLEQLCFVQTLWDGARLDTAPKRYEWRPVPVLTTVGDK
jgi:hypothetical protein